MLLMIAEKSGWRATVVRLRGVVARGVVEVECSRLKSVPCGCCERAGGRRRHHGSVCVCVFVCGCVKRKKKKTSRW